MTATSYDKVRFIGFAIPTTPTAVVGVGDVTGSGAVAGTYPGFDDATRDITARIEVMKSAVEAAFEQISTSESDVLNIFVAPEFYWHSTVGPYIYSEGESDPAEEILAQLTESFPASEYPNTVFVFGSVISAQIDDLETVLEDSSVVVRNRVVKALGEGWADSTGAIQDLLLDMLLNFVKAGHAYPKVIVRNRALVVGSELFSGVSGGFETKSLTTEKYFASNEDFLLWDVTGKPVITEQMVSYPPLDLSGGDLKKNEKDPKAIFTISNEIIAAVEICLDHSDHRLRRSAALSPWPKEGDGVQLHLIPSCGMQLHPASVAAKAGGYAFNCDGLYGLDGEESGTILTGVEGGVDSVHVSYIDGVNTTYGAHTQLTRVVHGPVGGDSAAPGAENATFTAPKVDVKIIEMPRLAVTEETFAGGAGAIHIYGLENPLGL